MAELVHSMRSVFIACQADAVFDVVADIAAWPQWAVHNVLSARALPDGTFEIETPRGPGRIRSKMVRECGILDHEFTDPREGTWLVPGRVAPFAGGAIVSVAFAKPPGMPDDAFATAMKDLDDELAHLKRLLENRE